MKRKFQLVATLLAGALLAGNAPAASTLSPASATTTVTVDVSGLRNKIGMVYVCMTAKPKVFPRSCDADPDRRVASIKASDVGVLTLRDVPPGRYAIALLHDENGNKKMDTSLFLPKEGFGFSRDAPVKLAAPKFGAAAFDVVAGKPVHMTMKVRYY